MRRWSKSAPFPSLTASALGGSERTLVPGVGPGPLGYRRSAGDLREFHPIQPSRAAHFKAEAEKLRSATP
ncbi:MAG TPA: hypothetical protein VJZ49_04900 [Syntrophales bacterium]|nr:hypothetical protein [Syntrophales bacterium]